MDFIWIALKYSKNVHLKDTDMMHGHLLDLCLVYSREQEAIKEGWTLRNCFKLWCFPCYIKDSVGSPPVLFFMPKKRGGSAAFHLPSHMCCFGVMCFISSSSGQGNIRQVMLNLNFYGHSIMTQAKKKKI